VEFAFGDRVLNTARRELRCGAELIAVQPQVFDLLVYLLHNRDRVVSKDDPRPRGLERQDRLRLDLD
jgi:DNA-binding winged helix-turn-helix (wHTH) protein